MRNNKSAHDLELREDLLSLLPKDAISSEIDLHNFLGNAYNFGDFFYYLFNLATQRFDFVGDEVYQVLGIESKDLDPIYFKNNMHPSDLDAYLEMEKIGAQFLFYSEPNQQFNYRIRYDCRIRHSDGNYVRILHQILPVKGVKDGSTFRILGVFTDISHLKMEGEISFSLIGLNGAPTYLGIDSLKNRISSENVLSKREIEILVMLSQDMISKEIAEALFISPQTVANHRKNMLMKTGAKSTIELLMKAIRNGWI